MRRHTVVVLALGSMLVSGCVHRHDHDHDRYPGRHPEAHRGHGPPPHAPAHGYRAKVRGYDLRFDSGHGAYVVVGLPGVYWSSGWFYRLWRDRWQRAGSGHGPWHDARWGNVPVGLRGGPGDDRGPGHGKGKGKAKGHGKKGY